MLDILSVAFLLLDKKMLKMLIIVVDPWHSLGLGTRVAYK